MLYQKSIELLNQHFAARKLLFAHGSGLVDWAGLEGAGEGKGQTVSMIAQNPGNLRGGQACSAAGGGRCPLPRAMRPVCGHDGFLPPIDRFGAPPIQAGRTWLRPEEWPRCGQVDSEPSDWRSGLIGGPWTIEDIGRSGFDPLKAKPAGLRSASCAVQCHRLAPRHPIEHRSIPGR